MYLRYKVKIYYTGFGLGLKNKKKVIDIPR